MNPLRRMKPFLLGAILLLLVLVLAFLLPTLAAQRRIAAANTQRCYLFTELIKPGMTRLDVREALNHIGPNSVTQAEFPGGLSQMYVGFSDVQASDRFGSELVLEFLDDQFSSAWIPSGVGEASPACQK